VTIVDPNTGAPLADSFIAIGYNLVPLGLVYDSTRSRFYVVTPPSSADPRFPPNSVIAFDPDTGTLGPSYTAESYLGQAALSNDASALYVVGDGEGMVLSLNPQTLTLESTFPFRGPGGTSPPFGFGYPSALAVMPEQPDTVAVNYAPTFNNSTIKLGVFDNGVARPIQGSPTGPGVLFSSDGQSIFTQEQVGAGNSIVKLAVNSSGIAGPPGSASGSGIPAALVNGLLYTTSGAVLDATTMQLAGNLGVSGSIAVDPVNQRILTLLPASPESLQAFDLATLEPLGSLTLPGIDNLTPPLSSVYRQLIRYGPEGVAYQSSTTLVFFQTPLAGPAPLTSAAAVVNAASNVSGPIAPGELLTIYGANLGPAQPVSANLGNYVPVPASLADVQVWFGDVAGRVLLGYQAQINVIAPFELGPGSSVKLQVLYFGIPSAQIGMPAASAAPGLFTQNSSGTGLAAVINQDGTVNTPSAAGSYISLYGTGGGALPGAMDGAIAESAANLAASAQVSINGENANVIYAGAAPTLADGVFQINVQVPADAPSGMTVPLNVTIGGQTGPSGVTLAIR
jgi:uncharacterized protein (TIGR03437 family)